MGKTLRTHGCAALTDDVARRRSRLGPRTDAGPVKAAARRPRPQRRGVIILVVFVIISGAALIMTSLSFLGRAEMRSAALVGRTAQAQALAWSGVQAVMAELDAQRQEMLDGRDPQITDAWSLYGTGSERGMIQLLPLGPEDELIVSESAKLDVNLADAESLAKMDAFLTPELAQAIVEARQARPGGRFDSITDLLEVDGIAPELLWGPLDKVQVQRAAASERDADVHFERRLRSLQRGVAGPEPRGLADLLTVFSIEPVIQSTGRYRININAKYDDRMHRRIARRYGEDLADTVRQFRENEPDLVITEKQWYDLLVLTESEDRQTDEYLDGFCLDEQKYTQGRVDLNRAPAEVLAALPGLDMDLAAALVTERETLSARDRAGLAWPMAAGALTEVQWAAAAPRLTWRTSAWRIRVLGRILVGEDEDVEVAGECVYEAVIDLSSPQPRVAYLRDITMLETAVSLRHLLPAPPVEDEARADEADGTPDADEPSSEAEAPSRFSSRRDSSGRLVDRPTFDTPETEEPTSPPPDPPYDGRDADGAAAQEPGGEKPPVRQIKPIGRWTGDR